MQLAKKASKRNQQATQAGQQRTSEEGNKYLKQVAELQNLTLAGHPALAGHPTMAGCPIITGHPSVATQPLVVRQPTIARHPPMAGYGMSISWQNVQDRVLQQQPTLQSWEDT
jgi:hypothetical protein